MKTESTMVLEMKKRDSELFTEWYGDNNNNSFVHRYEMNTDTTPTESTEVLKMKAEDHRLFTEWYGKYM